MRREGPLYGLGVLGVVVGLLVLLYGEASGGVESLVVGGGVVVLASVGLMTVLVARR